MSAARPIGLTEWRPSRATFLSALAGFAVSACGASNEKDGAPLTRLLNVSYDPTRELYEAINEAYAAVWTASGRPGAIEIDQSHGGSGRQARAVIDGLKADVVTLAVPYDIDNIAAAGLVARDWRTRLPHNSAPFTSTIVFLVRTGNPKNIRDWPDLVRDDIAVITPNPKTSGGARWNYLAAWGYAQSQPGADEAAAKSFVQRLYANVSVLDTGARGATTTFVQRGIGDVLIAWESEAHLARAEMGGDDVEIVTPSTSILAEPPVAWLDRIVEEHATREIAEAYLRFLYTPQAQEIAAQNFYRPTDPAVLAKHRDRFTDIPLISVDQKFGDWTQTHQKHFAEGGIFDQITANAQ